MEGLSDHTPRRDEESSADSTLCADYASALVERTLFILVLIDYPREEWRGTVPGWERDLRTLDRSTETGYVGRFDEVSPMFT